MEGVKSRWFFKVDNDNCGLGANMSNKIVCEKIIRYHCLIDSTSLKLSICIPHKDYYTSDSNFKISNFKISNYKISSKVALKSAEN